MAKSEVAVIVAECENGIQLEVVARMHNPDKPQFTHLAELPEATRKALATGIKEIYERMTKPVKSRKRGKASE